MLSFGITTVTDMATTLGMVHDVKDLIESGDMKLRFYGNLRNERGSFTELIRTLDHGQVSINISKPGITKGQHWHHSKWEKFLVVSGEALIQLRRVGLDSNDDPYPIVEYRVSGDDPTVVEMELTVTS